MKKARYYITFFNLTDEWCGRPILIVSVDVHFDPSKGSPGDMIPDSVIGLAMYKLFQMGVVITPAMSIADLLCIDKMPTAEEIISATGQDAEMKAEIIEMISSLSDEADCILDASDIFELNQP